MNFFTRGCESRQAAYLTVADSLGARERVAFEAHAAACAGCADALSNTRPVDIALRRAFAPLRERRTMIAPGRVRLAVGPMNAPSMSPWLRTSRFFGRLAEVSVMVGVTLLVAGSSLESRQSSSIGSTHSVVQDYFRALPPADSESLIVPDTAPLRRGGRLDVDPVEVQKARSALPRF